MPALRAFEETLRAVVDDALVAHRVPGSVVGIIRDDERLVLASGTANVGTGVATTPDTLFQIGSISKLFTATLVMQLVHAGVVELDEPVRGALQEFRVADDTATLTITPRHLLSHTSGIEGDHFLDCGRNPDALWRYVSTLEEIGQVHDPDDLFSYCNAGFGVLGRLVEEATGDHFTRALHRRIVRPLGLQRTVTLAEQAIVHRVATGHHFEGDDVRVTPWTLARFNVPIGGIIADVADILTFAGLHLRSGKNEEGKQVVPSRALNEMTVPQVEVPGGTGEWGLGWGIERWGDQRVLGHDGDTVGQRTFLRVFPEANAAIAVLTNAPTGRAVAEAVFQEAGPNLLSATPPALPRPLPASGRPDNRSHTGIFERMHQRLALVGRDDGTLDMTVIPDELFVLAGRSEQTLRLDPIGDDCYLTTDPATGDPSIVALLTDPDDDGADEGRPSFVHFGRRAHRRIS